ncbi:MAG: ABC transporter ATP-binding protein [Natrialbaceae archaeon]|nr:ABC transporter ATP-binding protein [Natrialbaceae archaeon]
MGKRHSARRWSGSSSPRAEPSGSRGRTSRRLTAPSFGCSDRDSSTSSRTPRPVSTRASASNPSCGETLDIHHSLDSEARSVRISQLLEQVGLRASHAERYPHQLSGGQRQRVGIARALAVEPSLIVLDEPLTGVDVSVQAKLLDLLERLQADLDSAYLLIAHDLAVVEHVCDRVAVMYQGQLVERGPVSAIFEDPSHPYTEALLSAIPVPDPRWDGDRIVLEGAPPDPSDPPAGCRFHPRCHRLIPPAEFAIDRDTMQGVLALRNRLRSGERPPDRSSLSMSGSTSGPGGRADTGRGARDSAEPAAALERLEALTSPCEQTQPPLEAGTAEHPIACHHYQDCEGQSEKME